jgi:hypothetical protein
MSLMGQFARRRGGLNELPEVEVRDEELEQALADFRSSVHAWSEAEYSRPRMVAVHLKAWGLAAVWALGCALLAGTVSGGVYEFHHRQQVARIAAAREAEHQRQFAEQRIRKQAMDEEELLAAVDSDVSREVPSAMEPLAQLMTGDESR